MRLGHPSWSRTNHSVLLPHSISFRILPQWSSTSKLETSHQAWTPRKLESNQWPGSHRLPLKSWGSLWKASSCYATGSKQDESCIHAFRSARLGIDIGYCRRGLHWSCGYCTGSSCDWFCLCYDTSKYGCLVSYLGLRGDGSIIKRRCRPPFICSVLFPLLLTISHHC